MNGLKILMIALVIMNTLANFATESKVTVTASKLEGNPTLSQVIDHGIRVYLKEAKCENKFTKEFKGDLPLNSDDTEYKKIEHWQVSACGKTFDYKIRLNKDTIGFDIVPFKP